jgi:TIR domain
VGKIFVSYRRRGAHALAVAGLAARLAQHFGRDRVFIDTRLVPGGQYPEELESELAASDVVIAAIHDGWVADFAEKRRLDWVRHELSTALRMKKTVIPVLLEPAVQPNYDQVPSDVARVTLVSSTPLRLAHYDADLATLVAAVERTAAAPDVPLAVADPEGDEPRPRRRLMLLGAIWGAALGGLALFSATALGPIWQTLMIAAYATVLMAAALTATIVLVAWAGPWLDHGTRRVQERSFAATFNDLWPLYAVLLLGIVAAWVGLLVTLSRAGAVLLVLLTGAAAIVVGWLAQHEFRRISQVDTTWPPRITPDSRTWRRAATRLHELLTADPRTPRDFARQRQAESVYQALREVRTTLDQRANRTWQQWLHGARHDDPLSDTILGIAPISVALAIAALTTGLPHTTAPLRLTLAATAAALAALTIAAAALRLGFLSDRRSARRLVTELSNWDARLRPLIYP